MKIPRACGLPRLVLSAALLAAAPGTAEHREDSAAEQERAELGAVSYRIHCQSCHGGGGSGDGPMAELLKISPPDLTRLAEQNSGEFPGERAYRAIDGRGGIAAHGSREMPVWGIGFQDLGRAADQEEAVRAKILDLVAYLKTLQRRPGRSRRIRPSHHPPG